VGVHCLGYWITFAVAWVFGSAFTSLLFLIRVLALYRGNKMVIGVFAFLWLCAFGSALTIPIGDGNGAKHFLPNNPYCISTVNYPAYEGAGFIIPAIFDTLVFTAISYRLYPSYEVSPESTWRAQISVLFSGRGIPKLSRALMESGQQYYL
jgi:hypothetical protein